MRFTTCTLTTHTHDTGLEIASLHKASHADLVRSCRHANRELRQHKLYLDQLLTLVIEKHPELLAMLSEAQRMRLDSLTPSLTSLTHSLVA